MESGYFRAKLLQEKLISGGPIPYTIVHATQFFEFLTTIADSATVDGTVRLPPALIQPMASADVAEAVAIAATGDPANGSTEVGGPEAFALPDLIRTALTARGDARDVVSDPAAPYWEVNIDERTLVPGDGAALFDIRSNRTATSGRGCSGSCTTGGSALTARSSAARLRFRRTGSPTAISPMPLPTSRPGPRSAESEVLDALPDNDVKAALAALPEGLRTAMYHVGVQGHTYAETAAIMGIPQGTVMSRVSRGRQRLRIALTHLDHARGSGAVPRSA